ncbi:hypothetical protein MPH_12969, partial [Macrophomina phaseolina MS6]
MQVLFQVSSAVKLLHTLSDQKFPISEANKALCKLTLECTRASDPAQRFVRERSACSVSANKTKLREVRLCRFATVYKARDHVEKHLGVFKLGEPIACPHAECRMK